MLPNKKNATIFFFLDFGLFWPFLNKKTAKKKKKKGKNPNRLMKFFEIWFVDASQLKNVTNFFFFILDFFGRFLTKKQSKLAKNDEN